MVIPRSLREEVGVSEGAMLKVVVTSNGQFLVTPQLTVDRPTGLSRKNGRKQLLRDLAAVVQEIRKEAKDKGIDKMPMSEINSALASARKALSKKTPKRP
jgi:antitoxin component of MazEF toxin-antitoxin module